jgi:phosphatidylserine decarboxylase
VIAKEGIREISIATLLLGALAVGLGWLYGPLAILPGIVWIWVLSFFRDPKRQGHFAAGELCSAADGRVTEITELAHYEPLDGPAVRIGAFLSIFNVHINRSPCTGTVRAILHQPGKFLDARHEDSGRLNESNTLLIDPDPPVRGPIEVRQVAGKIARRIICHARPGDRLRSGERFGMIKFGSRTEVIIPRVEGTKLLVKVGDVVRAGLTVLARQPVREVATTAMPIPTKTIATTPPPVRAAS